MEGLGGSSSAYVRLILSFVGNEAVTAGYYGPAGTGHLWFQQYLCSRQVDPSEPREPTPSSGDRNSIMPKHIPPQTVSRLLSDANRKFTDGEVLQASELMWKATRQAVAAVAARWDWPCASDDDISQVVRRLDEECGRERIFLGKFGIAETFQYNATQDILEDCEIEAAREVVVDLINHLLSQLAKPRQPGMNTEEHLAVDRGELP